MKKSRVGCVQRFSEPLVTKWLHILKDDSTKEFLDHIVNSSSLLNQLKVVKKIEHELKKERLGGCNGLLRVLVEMHSECSARHPLQRSVSGMLLKLPSDQRKAVVMLVSNNLLRVVRDPKLGKCQEDRQVGRDGGETAVVMEMLYFSSLLENFPLGEAGLKCQLPLVVMFCCATLEHWSSVSFSTSCSLTALVHSMKITMNLLHTFSLDFVRSIFQESSWPPDRLPIPIDDRKNWVEARLLTVGRICEGLLTKEGLPHDPVLAAAMLLVVVDNIISSSYRYPLRMTSLSVHRWLTLEGLSLFSRLSLYHAFLAKLSTSALIHVTFKNKPLLLTIFSSVCDLFDRFTESSERCIGASTLSLWSGAAKQCLLSSEDISLISPALCPTGETFSALQQYVWSLWEDPLDGIRHHCKEIFENMICIYQQLAPDKIFGLAERLLALESPTRGKFVFLVSLAPHVSTRKIVSNYPDLPADLLSVMGQQSLACHAGDLWTKMVGLHWQECNGTAEERTAWDNTWVLAVLKSMCMSSPLARGHITQHCLPALFRSHDCMEYVTAKLECIQSSPESRVATHLACLRCARTECKSFTPSLVSFETIFKSSMHHSEEQVRLFALSMICECLKTTDAPPPAQLGLLLHFVEVNGNSQSAGFRIPVLTSFKKVFNRIRDSSYSLLKLQQKGRGSDPKGLIQQYKMFLQDLLNQQFRHLHPISSFQRRNFSLSILQLLASCFPSNSPSAPSPEVTAATLPPVLDFSLAVSCLQASCLVEGLRDPYEANRHICLQLLQALPMSKIGLIEVGTVETLVARYFLLVNQPKSVSCSSASCLLKLLITHCNADLNLHLFKALSKDISSVVVEQPPVEELHSISTLKLLCRMLDGHISLAKTDLSKASMSAPMYGLVQSMRSVIEQGMADANSANFKHDLHRITDRVVLLCQSLSDIVSPIVCSSSPEGFFPDAVAPHQDTLPAAAGGPPAASGNAQSLLLCCWHTMKEVSLLLGTLVQNFSHTKILEGADAVLADDQMDIIAAIFIHQLTEARHRGAFEMAHTGFSKLCRSLWSSPTAKRNERPKAWLGDLLDSLQSSSVARLLTVTRRSAGLPFFVQAILSAETALTGRPCLKSTMRVLLKVARDAIIGQEESVPCDFTSERAETMVAMQPAAVHALNILRALYRDARLGEHVAQFIPEGVVIAVSGFGASLWPVRNSSSLLFTALVLRIFGAKKVLDEHSMENKMTAREFFARFPSLHGYLLQQLQMNTERLVTDRNPGSLQPSLLPLLLLLSRLYPSPLDEALSPSSLAPFMPLLIRCTCCSVWKTRVLVARTVSLMLTEHNCWSVLCQIYDLMSRNHQNALHGLLLVVGRSVQDRERLLAYTSNGKKSVLFCLLELHLGSLWAGNSCNGCPVTRSLYLEILVSLLQSQDLPTFLQNNQELLSSLTSLAHKAVDICNEPAMVVSSFIRGEEVFLWSMKLLLQLGTKFRLVFTAEAASRVFFSVLRSSESVAIRVCALDCIKSLEGDCSLSDECLVELLQHLAFQECDADLLINVYRQLSARLPGTELKAEQLNELLSRAYHFLLQSCCRIELRVVLVQFLSVVLVSLHSKGSSCFHYFAGLLEAYEKLTVPTQACQLRLAIASHVLDLWPLVAKRDEGGEVMVVIIRYCQLVVGVLQDPDHDVRVGIANAVARLLQEVKCCDFDSLNPSSALKFFVASLSHLLPGSVEVCFKLLTSLLPGAIFDLEKKSATNPLFDEDPVNDYEEEVVLMECVVESLQTLLAENQDVAARLRGELLQYLSAEGEVEGRSPGLSWWEAPRSFLGQTRTKLLRPIVEGLVAGRASGYQP